MSDHRRYVRMGTVFPVEFAIVGTEPHGPPGHLLQGFTCNVSEGGMCIEFKSFGKETEEKLNDANASLSLIINPSFSREPIHAHARIMWIKKQDLPQPSRYLIGVLYESIDPLAQKRLISYARHMHSLPRWTATIGIVLLAVLAGFAWHTQRLLQENLRLASELREGASRRSDVAGELVTLADSRRSLEKELTELREESERASAIHAELERIGVDQQKLRQTYRSLEESGRANAKSSVQWMSGWLASHQNLKTGLVASFEGDPSLEDTAFTYDQSLAAQAFLLTRDTGRASAILSFFDSRTRSEEAALYNSYDTIGGSPQEATFHVGPNLWMGIAALQYARQTGDDQFVPMAKRLADWAMGFADEEGGLRGGPGSDWYSTEHNLDAYAYFGMLYETTGEERYALSRDRVLAWLKKYAYSNKASAVNRGKGDATIATDTLAWSIAAIGPAKLREMGFDPEGILEFAEKNCEVTVEFRHPNGQTVQVKGFDFAKAKHAGRGGVVSSEWTAQMAVSYQVLARYFDSAGDTDKALRYAEKAAFYSNELQKMMIASPSRTGQGRGCLPYASADNVETGHGWRTPNGSSTGSVAGTAYGLFAWEGYNPFELTGKKEDPHAGL